VRASQSPGPVLRELGKLSPRELAKSLAALQRITEQPIARVAPDPTTLRDVAVKLSAVGQSTPDYWRTALDYIRWASVGMSPNAPPPGSPASQFNGNTVITNDIFSGTTVALDGASLQNAIFDHCRVIFKGNPSRLQNVTFINCVFEFPVTDQPPAPLRQMGEQLLAEGIQHAVVSIL